MDLGVGEGALARGLDLAVRLPPLYLMDMILIQVNGRVHLKKYQLVFVQNLGVWTKPSLAPPTPLNPESVPSNLTETIANSSDLYSTFAELYGASPMLLILPHVARFSLCSLLYIISLLVFLLPSTQVVTFNLLSFISRYPAAGDGVPTCGMPSSNPSFLCRT